MMLRNQVEYFKEQHDRACRDLEDSTKRHMRAQAEIRELAGCLYDLSVLKPGERTKDEFGYDNLVQRINEAASNGLAMAARVNGGEAPSEAASHVELLTTIETLRADLARCQTKLGKTLIDHDDALRKVREDDVMFLRETAAKQVDTKQRMIINGLAIVLSTMGV